jgi:acetate kinase
LERADAGDADALLGPDVYLHRLRAGIAAMTAALGGLDVLVFTGGAGADAPRLRALAAEGLGFLRVALDARRNADGTAGDRDISATVARVRTSVMTAREDLEISRQVHHLLINNTNKENNHDLDVLRRVG